MNLRFLGQYYDTTTGLHYSLNRYYNPALGRYMEPDPIGLEGGLNPYVYAGSRGSEYCSQKYQDLLSQYVIVCSMSHKGLCYDNAVMQRFFLNLKMERVWQHEQYMA